MKLPTIIWQGEDHSTFQPKLFFPGARGSIVQWEHFKERGRTLEPRMAFRMVRDSVDVLAAFVNAGELTPTQQKNFETIKAQVATNLAALEVMVNEFPPPKAPEIAAETQEKLKRIEEAWRREPPPPPRAVIVNVVEVPTPEPKTLFVKVLNVEPPKRWTAGMCSMGLPAMVTADQVFAGPAHRTCT